MTDISYLKQWKGTIEFAIKWTVFRPSDELEESDEMAVVVCPSVLTQLCQHIIADIKRWDWVCPQSLIYWNNC